MKELSGGWSTDYFFRGFFTYMFISGKIVLILISWTVRDRIYHRDLSPKNGIKSVFHEKCHNVALCSSSFYQWHFFLREGGGGLWGVGAIMRHYNIAVSGKGRKRDSWALEFCFIWKSKNWNVSYLPLWKFQPPIMDWDGLWAAESGETENQSSKTKHSDFGVHPSDISCTSKFPFLKRP